MTPGEFSDILFLRMDLSLSSLDVAWELRWRGTEPVIRSVTATVWTGRGASDKAFSFNTTFHAIHKMREDEAKQHCDDMVRRLKEKVIA